MNLLLGIALLMAVTSLANSALHCPQLCDYPRNERECRSCYEHGVTDMINGKGHREDRKWADILRNGSLRTDASAAHRRSYEWSSVVKGMDFEQCHTVGRAMFGYGRCKGFAGVHYYEKSTRCWTSFEPPKASI